MRQPTDTAFDRRLARWSALAPIGSRLIVQLVSRSGWVVSDNQDKSRSLRPPRLFHDDSALRMHWESFAHAPALEFDLRTLRKEGAGAAAESLHADLCALTDRKLTPDFPSLPLELALMEWEAGARNAVSDYVTARDRLEALRAR
jgi:hypothetical protein